MTLRVCLITIYKMIIKIVDLCEKLKTKLIHVVIFLLTFLFYFMEKKNWVEEKKSQKLMNNIRHLLIKMTMRWRVFHHRS